MALQIAKLLRPASFRGVPFKLFNAEMVFGRRNVLHEYPYRDEPYGEDLGRKGREITFDAYTMITSDYNTRDQLIAAIELNSTPGTLIHPSLGTITVIPKDCKHRYNNLEGGIEYFTLTFVEAGTQIQSAVSADTNGVALDQYASLKNNAVTFFSSNYKTSGYPNFIAQSALYNLQQFSKAITQAANFAGAANDTSGNFTGFLTQLAAFNSSLSTLVYKPTQLAQAITDLNSTLNAAFSNNLKQATIIQNQLWLYETWLKLITDPTTLGGVLQNNQNVLILLVQISVISELIVIVTKTTFISLEQATLVQDNLAAMAQSVLTTLGNAFDDEMYQSLKTAVDSMVANIQSQAATLAQVKTVLIQQNTPALVVAYSQYDDASQDLALVEQNQIINPGFIPSGTELAILV